MEIKPWSIAFNEAKAAIFLYLAFKGADYPYHIYKFFKDSGLCKLDGLKTLNHPNKVSSLLREMEKDNLVIEKIREEFKNLGKEEQLDRIHNRIYYYTNSNVIFLSSNYFPNDNEIKDLKDKDKDSWNHFKENSEIQSFNWVKDAISCPHCRERYLASQCWQMKRSGKCLIRQTTESPRVTENENPHHLCDALSSPRDVTPTDNLHQKNSQYEEPPLPQMIYEYCEPEKVFTLTHTDEEYGWSEGIFIENFNLSDEEIKEILFKIKKFDYLTILLVIRDLILHIILMSEMGSIDIGSADVKSVVTCSVFPSDDKMRQDFIEELVDWKIFYKIFSREYQINRIIQDIKNLERKEISSPSVLFNFLSYERTINSIRTGSDREIPHKLIYNDYYDGLLVGINQLISKHLLDQRIKEKGNA